MEFVDPTSSEESTELNSLTPRIDTLEGKRIGLYDNAKLAGEAILTVVREKLDERHSDVTFDYYDMEHLNYAKDPEKLAAVTTWASEDIDVCIGAIGDCGSCTKFLAWGVQAVEEAGVPSVGLVDEGFALDWKSNAIERGWPLRYSKIPVRAELRDKDRIREDLTPEAMDAIEEELIRPLTENEKGMAASQ